LPSDLIASNEYEKPRWKAGFFVELFRKAKGRESKEAGNFPPLCFSSYQLRKQWRPNGPECQPGGQLYIGRQPP
jgi:hypothetical protein